MPASLLLLVPALAAGPARAADEPPVALAGASFLAYPEERIILDGSQSYDPEGYPLTYQWTQVYGPTVALVNPTSAHPEFDTLEPGVHGFQLVVDDGVQPSEPDVVDVIVVDPGIGAAEGGGGCSQGRGPSGSALPLLLAPLALLRRRRR